MLTLNLLTLQDYYFWKDVAFWNNFSNVSIKSTVSEQMENTDDFRRTWVYSTLTLFLESEPGLGIEDDRLGGRAIWSFQCFNATGTI